MTEKVNIIGISSSDLLIHTTDWLLRCLFVAEVPHFPKAHPQCWALQGQEDPHPGAVMWALSKGWKSDWATIPAPWNSQFLRCDPLQTRGSICDVTDCSFDQALPSTSCSWGKFSKLGNEHWGNNRSSLFSWAVVGSHLKYFMSIIHSKMLWKVYVCS